jgi:hypothetical protein
VVQARFLTPIFFHTIKIAKFNVLSKRSLAHDDDDANKFFPRLLVLPIFKFVLANEQSNKKCGTNRNNIKHHSSMSEDFQEEDQLSMVFLLSTKMEERDHEPRMIRPASTCSSEDDHESLHYENKRIDIRMMAFVRHLALCNSLLQVMTQLQVVRFRFKTIIALHASTISNLYNQVSCSISIVNGDLITPPCTCT